MDEILRLLGPGAGPFLALLFVLLWRRDIVFGWQYKELYDAHQELKKLVLAGLHATEISASAAEKALDVVPVIPGKGQGL